MATYRWGFELIGTNWVDGLSWSLHGPDIAILREEDDDFPPVFMWASEHLNALDEGPELMARAAALKVVFDGAMYLERGLSFRPERLGELISLKDDRRRGFPAGAVMAEPFDPAVVARPLGREHQRIVASNLLEGSLHAARTDPVVRGILTVLGQHGITFASLYQVRDFMKTHGMSEDDIARHGGVSKAELNRFTHTANNFESTGAAARHGDLGHSPPPKPMSLDEAAAIVLTAAKVFVSGRIKAITQRASAAAGSAV